MRHDKLDDYAKKVRQVKNDFNSQWSRTSHADAIDDQKGITGFDQIMDQVFKLVECYQEIGDNGAEPTLQKASDAHVEAVKAACAFYESIATAMVVEAKGMIEQVRPVSEQLLAVNPHVVECRTKIEHARDKWEDDSPEALKTLGDVIDEMDKHLDNIKLALPAAALAEKRQQLVQYTQQQSLAISSKQLNTMQWGIVVAVVTAIVAAVLSLLVQFGR